MIDITKQYKTRDGREVRIYATDGLNGHRVHGAIRHPEYGWEHRAWFTDGRMYSYPSDSDLIEVKPRIKREVWVNVYPDTEGLFCYSKEEADAHASEYRIACVKLVIDCEEGHGLD
jgi:hypothetical protein